MEETDGLVVLVGVHSPNGSRKERLALADAVESVGFEVEPVERAWPADHYVFANGRYTTREEHRSLGEGGYFRFGDGYCIVSDCLTNDEYERECLVGGHYMVQHGIDRMYVFPAGINILRKEGKERHIDMTTLLLPKSRLLVVDENFYRRDGLQTVMRDVVEKLADSESLEVIFYRSSTEKSFTYFPVNGRVLSTEEGELVVMSHQFPDLAKQLDAKGIETLLVNLDNTSGDRCSVNCCTNIRDASVNTADILDRKEGAHQDLGYF